MGGHAIQVVEHRVVVQEVACRVHQQHGKVETPPELKVDHVGADRLDGNAVAASARQRVVAHRLRGIERRGRHAAAGELSCMPRRAGGQFEHRCIGMLSCTVSRNQGRQRVALGAATSRNPNATS